ncbi:uncharacterized protein LOC110924027 [Helianthus annuus]|uniref:uncharacterized protein LOC110924027 n=1 Tax=Helianthus annuus TaxID=4232 RepID=UPI000B905880|nr:uncharacterized protein LOC110924027 [Helianthus annuus]
MFKAKGIAKQKIEGDYRAQYVILRDYSEELMKSNPGTTVTIDVEPEANPSSPTRHFRRIYICLGGLKAGFKLYGRPLLGLDGAFMKGPFPGQVLTSVGLDSNNGIYPVAFALVEAETKNSWVWFLNCLGHDLDLQRDSYFTFITDRQKGFIPAIQQVFPYAEHRFCLRHVHENMKPRWKGELYKNLLWKCASSTTVAYFEQAMKEVLATDEGLYQWLREIPHVHWTRAYFSGRAISNVLLNNLCEVFNRQLVEGRDKPVITCLEYIREYLMRRNVVVHILISKSEGHLTPTATEIFDKIKEKAADMSVQWNAVDKYQVKGSSLEQCVVNMADKTCSCRRWELTGMPCKHAVAVIWDMAAHGIEVDVPEKWVSQVYWLQTWKQVYAHTMDPINGRNMWLPSACPTTLVPPKHHKQVGRPRKKRKKSAEELTEQASKQGKLYRIGQTVKCTKCGRKGHNQRSCKGTADGCQSNV